MARAKAKVEEKPRRRLAARKRISMEPNRKKAARKKEDTMKKAGEMVLTVIWEACKAGCAMTSQGMHFTTRSLHGRALPKPKRKPKPPRSESKRLRPG